MSQKIQWRRGVEANLPALDVGEPALTTDTGKPFIGGSSGNIQLAKSLDLTAYAKKTQEMWIKAVLQNGWLNFGTGWNEAEYFKDEMGFVHLRGLIKSGSLVQDNIILNLPVGYRPNGETVFPTISNDGTTTQIISRFDVLSNGNVLFRFGANAFFSLDGCVFKAEL